MNSTTCPALEILEDRIAPAGVVTALYDAVTGELTLTGDTAHNAFTILQTGPASFRVEGLFDSGVGASQTFIDAPGATTFDLGKLTKLTIDAGEGDDSVTLFNLRGLTAPTSLSFLGGLGDDTLDLTNLTAKGAVKITTGDGLDTVQFLGNSTVIGGDLIVTDSADGVNATFLAAKTAIGGTLDIAGGTGAENIRANAGTIAISKGVRFAAGTGAANSLLSFATRDVVSIGKLPTGESILFTGGDGTDEIFFGYHSVTLASGLRMTGGANGDVIEFAAHSGAVRFGKLATGQSILFDGGADTDRLLITAANLNFAGGIEFLGDTGNNQLALTNGNGVAQIGKLSGGQSILFTGGAGDDLLYATSSRLTLVGGLEFAGGDGENSIDFLSGTGAVKLGTFGLGRSLSYSGGSGTDSLFLNPTSLVAAGGIDFTGGEGVNQIAIPAENGRVSLGRLTTGQSIRYSGGASADSVTVTTAALALTGGIEFDGGAGTNLVAFGNSSGPVKIGSLSTGRSINYLGGAGSDSLLLAGSALTLVRGIEFAGGDGANTVDFYADSIVTIGANNLGSSIQFTGGADVDSLGLRGARLTLTGAVEMTGGAGDDRLDFTAERVAVGRSTTGVSVLLTGGDDDDVLHVEKTASFGGSLTLDGGNGDDDLELIFLQSLSAKGTVGLLGGDGDDSLSLDAHSLALGGSLSVFGGAGEDFANIISDGSIAGNVIIDLGLHTGVAGAQFITLASKTGLPAGLVVKGALLGAAAADTAADYVTLRNLSVAKAISFTLGAGASVVTIDNLVALSTVTLDTGDGDDLVQIERNNFFGNSLIARLATIQLGAGDDQLVIGDPFAFPNAGLGDSTRVRFLAGLNADAGTGTNDNRNDIVAENTHTLAPAFSNFESASL